MLIKDLLQDTASLNEARKVSSAVRKAGSAGGKYNFNGTDYGTAAEAKEAKTARVASLTKEIAGLKDDSPMKTPLSKELARIKNASVGTGEADKSKAKEVNKKVYAKNKGEDEGDSDEQKAEKEVEKGREASWRKTNLGEKD